MLEENHRREGFLSPAFINTSRCDMYCRTTICFLPECITTILMEKMVWFSGLPFMNIGATSFFSRQVGQVTVLTCRSPSSLSALIRLTGKIAWQNVHNSGNWVTWYDHPCPPHLVLHFGNALHGQQLLYVFWLPQNNLGTNIAHNQTFTLLSPFY